MNIQKEMGIENPQVLEENQIKQLASGIADALLNSDDLAIEIRNITMFMEQTKREIQALRPKELAEDKIPDATNVLDIIIKTNEEACAKILACAENLNEVAENTPGKLRETLCGISTELFEASTFDDLNGQRVRKVIKTFQEIENRLTKLLSALKIKDADAVSEVPEAVNLMEGPQHPEEATSQDEIDRLLKGL